MIAEAASNKFVTLTYMTQLTDFVWCLPVFFLVLMDTFENREFILGQIAYTFKSSSSNASMQPPMPLTFSHGPVILPLFPVLFNFDLYLQNCSFDSIYKDVSHRL